MTGQHGNRTVPTDTGDVSPRAEPLSQLVTDSRCRYVLYRLREQSPRTLPTLARDIARWEGNTTGDVPPERVRSVYLDLYYTQLPKLSKAGLVDYSDSLGNVLLVNSDESVTRCLDAAVRHQDS